MAFSFCIMSFGIGVFIGQLRAANRDVVQQTAYMQDLIDEAYAKRDFYRQEAEYFEKEMISWQDKYEALIERIYKAKKKAEKKK